MPKMKFFINRKGVFNMNEAVYCIIMFCLAGIIGANFIYYAIVHIKIMNMKKPYVDIKCPSKIIIFVGIIMGTENVLRSITYGTARVPTLLFGILFILRGSLEFFNKSRLNEKICIDNEGKKYSKEKISYTYSDKDVTIYINDKIKYQIFSNQQSYNQIGSFMKKYYDIKKE